MPLAEISTLPSFVEAARRYYKGVASEEDASLLREASLRPIEGGFNNAVYAFQHNGQLYCIKLYRVDRRRRAQTEWCALTLLASQGYRYSPQPSYFSAEPAPPAVVMEFVHGQGLGGQHLTRTQLSALAGALQEMHTITPESVGEQASPINSWACGKIRLLRHRDRKTRLLKLMNPSALDALAREAHNLLRTRLQGADPAILLKPAPVVFSPADHNLANCLWDGQRLRIVDFEFSGWSDRAFDLGEQTEHIQSRGTPDEKWEWFVEQFDLSPEERVRFRAAQQLLALFWVTKFWPKGAYDSDSERERFASQLRRAQRLCTKSSKSE